MPPYLCPMPNAMFRVPTIFAPHTGLIAAESTRHGGVSLPPYASLNLGFSTDDDPDAVRENRRRFLAHWHLTETNLATSYQTHGTDIQIVTESGRSHGFDALLTNVPGLLLGISVADCTPILVYDTLNQAVAAIHAGWRGTVGGLVLKTLRQMQTTYGTQPAHCLAYVGTCIDECSFEVGADVATQFSASHVSRAGNRAWADLKLANADQFREFGLTDAQLDISPCSTVWHNDQYFSHRHEQGLTGRMMAVIGLR